MQQTLFENENKKNDLVEKILKCKTPKQLRQLRQFQNKILTMDEERAVKRKELELKYKNLKEFFATPAPVWQFMIENFCIYNSNGNKILDPCCGLGSFKNFGLKKLQNCEIIENELNKDFYNYLQEERHLFNFDFLNDNFNIDCNIIVMNPPFTLIKEFEQKAIKVIKNNYEHGEVFEIVPWGYKTSFDIEEAEELNIPKELTSKNFPVTCKIINYRF